MLYPVDYWAVFIAALAGNALGAVWYWALRAPWLAGSQLTEEDIARESGILSIVPYAIALAAQILMAFVLAQVIAYLGPAFLTIRAGTAVGVAAWVGFVLPSMLVTYTFARRPTLILVNGLYWLAVLALMGGVIGGMATT